MGTTRTYQTQSIIIKQTKLGEIDKIVTLYSPEFGKLKAVAKGACRPGSKLGGNVEPLTCSLVMLARGRNLDIITQSQSIDAFSALKSDLWRMACGLYILELIDSFTVENSENRPLFDLLRATLYRLCQADNSETVLRYFELHLLHYLGYRPQLRRCVSCDSPLKPVVNFFSPSEGGILCPHCDRHYEPFAPCHSEGERRPKNLAQDRVREAISLNPSFPLSVNAFKILRLWQSCDYATAKRVKVKPELSLELEQVLQRYIRYLLQREVKSVAWLKELRKESLVDKDFERN